MVPRCRRSCPVPITEQFLLLIDFVPAREATIKESIKMFQHRALSPPSIDLPPDLPQDLSRLTILRGLLRLDDIVPLPQTLRGYLVFLLALIVVSSLGILQVWTSLQVAQGRSELATLHIQHSLIEQQNAELLWQISQYTTLEQVQIRAIQLNFHPALKRKYIYSSAFELSDTRAYQQQANQQDGGVALQQPLPSTKSESIEVRNERDFLTPLPSFLTTNYENPLPGWQQQANERWQDGWLAMRQWAEPLLEQASDFFLGQLKQP